MAARDSESRSMDDAEVQPGKEYTGIIFQIVSADDFAGDDHELTELTWEARMNTFYVHA